MKKIITLSGIFICILIFFLLPLSFDRATVIKTPSFVCQYNVFESITATQLDNGGIEIWAYMHSKSYNIESKDEEKRIFDSLCLKHHDFTYDKEIRYRVALPNQCFAYDFTSVNVTSDSDFDDLHPFGSSLNDIFRFMSWSPYRYIIDEYIYDEEEAKKVSDTFKDFFGDTRFEYEKSEGFCLPIDKMMCDIAPEDMILLGNYNGYTICILKAESNPTISKEHNLTITLTADNGKTYSTTILAEFE